VPSAFADNLLGTVGKLLSSFGLKVDRKMCDVCPGPLCRHPSQVRRDDPVTVPCGAGTSILAATTQEWITIAPG
jgi:hypothetical protein